MLTMVKQVADKAFEYESQRAVDASAKQSTRLPHSKKKKTRRNGYLG